MKNEQNRILLVDDEKDLCWTFEMQFEDSEYELTTVQSGEKAVQEMKKSFYPLVILDSKLPGIDGFETARRLKKQHLKQTLFCSPGIIIWRMKKFRKVLMKDCMFHL